MATIIENPKVREIRVSSSQSLAVDHGAEQAISGRQVRVLFSESLIGNGSDERKRKTFTAAVSFCIQFLLVGVLVTLPLMFTDALPKAQLLTFLAAPPPPPPPPPPPAAAAAQVVRQTDVLNNGALRTPTRVPLKIAMIKEDEAPPPAAGGVIGGVPGGIPGGQLGGVIGGIVSSANVATAIPKLEPPKRVRISQGITQGMRIHYVEPEYPAIARTARIAGAVQLRAVIGKDGNIKELEGMSGHPILMQAALNAVKQWHYKPYLLNGEAVEVETNITVTFQLAG